MPTQFYLFPEIKMPDRLFSEGQRVLYVPQHAKGDRSHPACEPGVVMRYVDDTLVMVRYLKAHGVIRNMVISTREDDLVPL